jgi:hypothetical protein
MTSAKFYDARGRRSACYHGDDSDDAKTKSLHNSTNDEITKDAVL